MRNQPIIHRLAALLLAVLLGIPAKAQTDTEFWFVVPEVTIKHYYPGGANASFKFSTGQLASTITISMPANQYDPLTNPTGFPDIVINMPAYSFHEEDLTCWIVTPCSPLPDINTQYGAGAHTDVNKLENKPLNPSGINKFGIRITATNPITAYWEVPRRNNKEIWALKGKNALGTEFYTPFQTHGVNHPIVVDTPSAIDVVATEDNTVVTFQLPTGVAASYGKPMSMVPAGGTHTVTLMAGETFSLFPVNKSLTSAARLAGTRVTSTKPIAITLKDDSIYHTAGGCNDIAGDQLVPTSIVGKEYAIVRTFLDVQDHKHDHIYILGTVNGTSVSVYNTGGTLVGTTTVNAGQQRYYRLPAPETYYRVVASQPVYVWHVGGFGCEQGGAILPPIDICTGTHRVAFARTQGATGEEFFVIMIVRKGGENHFKIDGAPSPLFPGSSFVPIPNSNWSAARFGPFNTSQVSLGSHFMENTEEIFHLGVVNGGAHTGCMYGYFSDYNELEVSAMVAGTNSSVLKTCYGNPVQLRASDRAKSYLWSPDSTLSDPHSQFPWASPKVNARYKLVVSGSCNMTDSAFIDVLVSTPLTATFITDKVSGCAPLTVNFEDKSTGVKYWRYDMGDGTAFKRWDTDGATLDPNPPTPFTFSHTFTNTTSDTINYRVVLLGKNQDGCAEVYEKIITVLPSIDASFTRTPDEGCNPLAVTFTNASSSNTADIYRWEFGDGFTQVTTNPTGVLTHTYNNLVPRDSLFTVRMIATSPHGCRDTATATVKVYSFFNADFKVDVAQGCAPLTVNIDNISVGDAARYVWRLNGVQFKTTGADTTLVLTNTTNTYIDYVIQLQLFNGGDKCSQTVSRTVRVYPSIQAGFTVPQTDYCNLSTVNFTNTTTPASTDPGSVANVYSWDFGDGANSAQVSPSHTYDNQTNSTANHTVTLTARNQFGCQSTASQSVRIFGQIYADFAATPTQDCSPVTVSIDNNSRGGIVSYAWDYGDGTTGTTDLDHTHPYVNNGLTPIVRVLKLTVTNAGNCTSTLSRNVTIYPSVTAMFTPSVVEGCNELTVSFNNTSTDNATIFSWDFGNGNSSVEESPTHTFTNTTGADVTYTVTLNVQTAYGCTATTSTNITVYPFIDANFVIDTSHGCSPLDIWFTYTKLPGIVDYRWDWDGDGSTDLTTLPADDPKVFHRYVNQTGNVQNLNPRLTVRNHKGCTDFKVIPIKVYPEVKAAFTISNAAGCNPLDVTLTNSSHFAGTTTPLSGTTYYWTFGDGGSSNIASPIHIYSNDDPLNNATYTTWLKAVSQYGCADSTSRDVVVYNRVESHFTFGYASNCTPFDVTFYPAAIGASVYRWSYGGAPGLPPENLTNGTPFTRTFTNSNPNTPVTYTVTLRVENDEGCPSVQSREIEVYPILNAAFTPSASVGCSDLPVTFNNTSTGGNMVYLWDFGNGQSTTTSTQVDVTHTFTNRGSTDVVYSVKLKTVNPNGCRDSLTVPITIHPRVEANFAVEYTEQCTPFEVKLTNTSLNGTSFSWDYGYTLNGTPQQQTTTRPTLVHTYTFDNDNPNTILNPTITLAASQQHAGSGLTCSSTVSKPFIPVYPRVVANFDANAYQGCNPLTVNFNNLSTGLGQYVWDLGNGTQTTEVSPLGVVFTNDRKDQLATYTVRLLSTNALGCQDDISRTITVNPLVKAEFQWDRYEGCTPLTVNLSNSSTSPLYKYSWDFGDGSPKHYTEQPVSHLYTNPTSAPPVILNPTITLRTSYANDTLCIDSLKLPLRVFPHIYPEFTTNFAGCHPHSVTLGNQTVAFSANNTYFWNLGAGVNSVSFEPQFSYSNPSQTTNAIYPIRLYATSEHGCVDSVRHDVTVYPRPFAAMEIDGSYMACAPFDVLMENNSIGTNLTYHYRFGDGTDSTTTSQLPMLHRFDNLTSTVQPYQIYLRTVSQFGCDDSVSQIIYTYPHVFARYNIMPGVEGCSPFEISFANTSVNTKFYKWDFDDGITSFYSNPTHSFLNYNETDKLFNVKLRAWSEYNCVDVDTQQVTVWATPIADIAITPPLKVFPDADFNIHNQSNPGAAGWAYTWDFDDNTFSNLRDPGTHTYLRWGPKANDYKYNVKLKVESPHCKDSTVSTLFLLPAVPQPYFAANVDSACSPLEVHFINTSEWADSYLWDFGDGTTSTLKEPIHTFTEPGYYTVKLTISGDGGVRFYHRVFRVYKNPTAAFAVYPQRVMLPDATVHAYNLSTDYSRSLWDLGDGTVTTTRDPVHTYSSLGEFRVSLWVYMDYDNDVCVDSVSRNPAVWVEGSGLIKFPNAFKPSKNGPNGGVYDAIDYRNEVFHPYHQGVAEYKLVMFSRWGEQIFTSTNVNIGWDGYVNNKLAEQGVYMWRATGKFTNGKPFDVKGSVTLLR